MHEPRPSHEPYDPDEPYLAGRADEPFEQCFAPPRDSSAASSGPVPPCPKCQSTRVDARNLARKTGGAIGTLAGTTSGIAFALSGAETGATVGLLAGPAGATETDSDFFNSIGRMLTVRLSRSTAFSDCRPSR